ncbi:MAG: phage neck terminator protein [Steroidobacteraceae bacterium]
MTVTVSPSQDAVYQALESFITSVLGAGIPVIRGLPNRVAMPQTSPGFVLMQCLMINRLRWNEDTWDTTSATPTTMTLEEGVEVRVQLDFYGQSSGDWAATLSTLLRDSYGCAALGPNCQPLYADEARMMPLIDEEQQYEERWSLDARIQYNPVTTIPQTFANSTQISVINVNETYPP